MYVLCGCSKILIPMCHSMFDITLLIPLSIESDLSTTKSSTPQFYTPILDLFIYLFDLRHVLFKTLN